MNTDNFSILGLTIDYGPFAMMEKFDRQFVCNRSDGEGRYSYVNQVDVAFWNLTRMAISLKSIVSESERESALSLFRPTFESHYSFLMRKKLGLNKEKEGDETLITALLDLLELSQFDYTIFFRQFINQFQAHVPSSPSQPQSQSQQSIQVDSKQECKQENNDNSAMCNDDAKLLIQVNDNKPLLPHILAQWVSWIRRYRVRLSNEDMTYIQRHKLLHTQNPLYILRTYIAEEAIVAATKGDYSKVQSVLEMVQHPFDAKDQFAQYARPAPQWAQNISLSCSS